MTFDPNARRLVLALIACLPLLGCGQSMVTNDMEAVMERAESPSENIDPVALVSGSNAAVRFATTRKIIYTADIDLIVKNFGDFERQIAGIIESHGGFTAERKTDRDHGDHRGGTWMIRVPVEQYDGLLSGLSALGFARSRSETSDDVTEAYVDLQARISNKRKLEERIIAMLEERPGKLSDLMEIERELSRVREEIERMEGRMRVLTDQTSLATVKLRVSEEATYVPPTAPTLGDRVAASWGGSIASIGNIASGAVIATVALIPWAVIIVPLSLVAFRIRERFRGRPHSGAAAA